MMAKCRGGSSTLVLALLLGACSRQSCVNQASVGLPSPDGARIAYVFHRTCPNTPVTTHVSVIALPNSLRDETGNVLTVPGDQPIKIAWRGPTTLRVSGFTDPLFKVDHTLGPVTVDFP